jgi:hypothetical protein
MASATGKRKRDSDLATDLATEFRCSITAALIVEPVTTADGQLYEKAAIEEWLSAHSTSPNTGERLESTALTPAPAVRSAIERIVNSGGLPLDEVRTWRTKKALALIAGGDIAAAKAMLRDAKEAGDAAAGFHLGKLLLDEVRDMLDEAAAAGVTEAADLRSTIGAGGVATGDLASSLPPPLRRLSDIEIGEFVIVLTVNGEPRDDITGMRLKVIFKESDADALLVTGPTIPRGRGLWLKIGECGKAPPAGLAQ